MTLTDGSVGGPAGGKGNSSGDVAGINVDVDGIGPTTLDSSAIVTWQRNREALTISELSPEQAILHSPETAVSSMSSRVPQKHSLPYSTPATAIESARKMGRRQGDERAVLFVSKNRVWGGNLRKTKIYRSRTNHRYQYTSQWSCQSWKSELCRAIGLRPLEHILRT